ncbi:hypothetical protein LXL04_024223 [Taraxacum kok-saghyz]
MFRNPCYFHFYSNIYSHNSDSFHWFSIHNLDNIFSYRPKIVCYYFSIYCDHLTANIRLSSDYQSSDPLLNLSQLPTCPPCVCSTTVTSSISQPMTELIATSTTNPEVTTEDDSNDYRKDIDEEDLDAVVAKPQPNVDVVLAPDLILARIGIMMMLIVIPTLQTCLLQKGIFVP